jgi:ABC-2 type transport system permease protein
MNSPSNALSESFQAQSVAPATLPATQAFWWSVRREIWENRSIYIAPLALAAIALVAFSISSILGIWLKPLRLDSSQSYEAIAMPYNMVAGMLMLTGIVVSAFYCLDALYGERRDRSILFWKSLPVSDVTTVLAKASIPLVIVPLLSFAITFATQWLMLLVSSGVLLVSGQSVTALWTKLSFMRMTLLLLYHFVTAHALWPFPVYCWLLLASGWARRAPLLWAALPMVAIGGVEQLIFRTWHFAGLVGSRLFGIAPSDFTAEGMFPTGPMTHITPGRFLGSPGLWIGLVVAAAFLAVAIRLRRYRGPI